MIGGGQIETNARSEALVPAKVFGDCLSGLALVKSYLSQVIKVG
jgi:hypothetical protein